MNSSNSKKNSMIHPHTQEYEQLKFINIYFPVTVVLLLPLYMNSWSLSCTGIWTAEAHEYIMYICTVVLPLPPLYMNSWSLSCSEIWIAEAWAVQEYEQLKLMYVFSRHCCPTTRSWSEKYTVRTMVNSFYNLKNTV